MPILQFAFEMLLILCVQLRLNELFSTTGLGFGFSAFSPNIPFLMIFYGVIGGFGLGAMYLPSVVIVSQYFEMKRGLATGLAGCGSGKYFRIQSSGILRRPQILKKYPTFFLKLLKVS
jgi:MFS family permease